MFNNMEKFPKTMFVEKEDYNSLCCRLLSQFDKWNRY